MEHKLGGLPDRVYGRSSGSALPVFLLHLHWLQDDVDGVQPDAVRFIEEMTENKNIEMKIYLKEWHF
jgi:hypothetical protein